MPDAADGNVTSPPLPANLTAQERAYLKTFDTLDFEVFSNHDWARLSESHASYIRVHFPDGHIADMAGWAKWAPSGAGHGPAFRISPLSSDRVSPGCVLPRYA
jgi:hypothetical protein